MTPLAILMIMLNATHYKMNYQEHFFGVNNREHFGKTALISVTQYVNFFTTTSVSYSLDKRSHLECTGDA